MTIFQRPYASVYHFAPVSIETVDDIGILTGDIHHLGDVLAQIIEFPLDSRSWICPSIYWEGCLVTSFHLPSRTAAPPAYSK